MISRSASLLLILGALGAARVVTSAALRRAPIGEVLRRTPRQASGALTEMISPCPKVLSNILFRPDKTRWSGQITYTPEEDGYGVVVEIELDKRVNFLGSPLAEVSSNDSITHIIRDNNYQLERGHVLGFRFLVQFSMPEDPPRVKTIKFNGKQICPAEEDYDAEFESPPFVSPDVISTISPPFTTVPPPATTYRPPVSSEDNVDITVTTTVSSSSSTGSPPEKLTRKMVTTSDQYEISGNFKIYSNTSVVLLLAARPPNQGTSEETEIEADNLSKLIAQVFNTGSDSGPGSSGPTVIQVLPNAMGGGEDEEPPPPFTTDSRMQPGGSTAEGNNRLSGRRVDPAKWTSPCEGVFSYLTDYIKSDMWYGTLTLTSPVEVRGIRLDFELDKPARIFGAWLGEATDLDKNHYSVWNPWAEIEPNEAVVVRIFAKYDPDESDPPKIISVRFNGRKICPA